MKLNKLTYFFSLLTLIGILFSGCEKSLDSQRSVGGASISVKDVFFEEDNTDMDPNSSNDEFGYKSQSKKLGLIAFSHGRNIEVTLESNEPDPEAPRKVFASNRNGSNNQKAVIEQNLLPRNVRYHLLVYNEDGEYEDERILNYRENDNNTEFVLDGGVEYTFIAVSIGKSRSLPTIAGKNHLNTVKVVDCEDDLMVFRKKIKLNEGTNFLDIVLKHRFSALITKLSIDPNTTGRLTVLNNVKAEPGVKSASMNLGTDNQEITYSSDNSTNSYLTFPSVGSGVRSITSSQKLIINPLTNTGTLTFGKITIDGDTKTNLVISDIKIRPGVKYKLHLNFRTCTQDVTGASGLDWHYPEVTNSQNKVGIYVNNVFYENGSTISQMIQAPSADYGFVFDITELDNTFNMELGNVKLATREVQFQSNAMTSQNIRFEDGSYYEGKDVETNETIPAVYNMVGTLERPVVKVVISRTGEVEMWGSKKSGGKLYPLVLYNNTSFNKFTWNRTGANDVKITQVIDGRTIVKGFGSGKRKIACPN
ncbi:hypothetical protein ACFRAE_14840 [Sphingobacterium sp. HJSM2_6]|uniref:hypothetical protein n=1 Tax=Sphingobacterium sp. HJSM2_6 TaxID=3366264 RepID=UPI003BCC0F00